jgi:hypothetical protein
MLFLLTQLELGFYVVTCMCDNGDVYHHTTAYQKVVATEKLKQYVHMQQVAKDSPNGTLSKLMPAVLHNGVVNGTWMKT